MNHLDPMLLFYLAAGLMLGAGYFQALRWTIGQLTAGGDALAAAAATVGRFALLAGALVWISMHGALPLLLTGLGILISRTSVLRQARLTAL